MMGVNYSNVNPQASMGADIFSQSDINMVDSVISDLKAGNPVNQSDLDNCTRILENKREHPVHGENCDELISALYALNSDPDNQAHVIGNLIAPRNADLVQSLLNIPDNPLVKALGSQGTNSLIQAAGANTPQDSTVQLIQAARAHMVGIVPATYEDESHLEQQTMEDATGWLSDNLAKAIQQGDIQAVELSLNSVPNTSLPELSNRIAQMGEPARAVLSELANSSDTRINRFAFSTLLQIGNANLPLETSSTSDWGQGNGSGTVDMSSLESLLMAPENTPATLARQFAGVPGLHTHLVKLMIR
jgi:hypothetical protein